jgi:hypothetical protein
VIEDTELVNREQTMKSKVVVVSNKTPLDEINRAMNLPVELWSDDGREFTVKSWRPNAEFGRIITVSCELVVRLKKSDEDDAKP